MTQYLDLIQRIARHYTLPTTCAITRDDLIQEGCLGYLEAQISHPDADEKKWLNYARKAMQRAMARYVSPVTRSLDTTLYHDDDGSPITLADTLADTPSDTLADTFAYTPSYTNSSYPPPLRGTEGVLTEGVLGVLTPLCKNPPPLRGTEGVLGVLGVLEAFLSSLNTQLATGTITPANYRQKKHRFLQKLRRQVSQNRFSPV